MPRHFRFEAMWTRDHRCGEVIKEAWKAKVFGSPCFKLARKQEVTSVALRKWNKNEFGLCQTRIRELSNNIEAIQRKKRIEGNGRMEAKLQGELNEWMARNEILWRQKLREVWLKDGDKNSKIFHLSTIIRRRRNSINSIKGDHGNWITNKRDIRAFIVDKFQLLFQEEAIDFPQDLENLISPSLSPGDITSLCSLPTTLEIKDTFFVMSDQNALGNDGLPTMFYKRYWATIGLTVTAAIQSFFSAGKMLKEINNTLIVLIPKNSSPSTVNHFRPISLCNTVYKAILKLLVARVRPVLNKLISPCQSAFIPGTWIAENPITVHELLHSFKRRKVKEGFISLKIDIQKAYDHINWGFLKVVLKNFGFPDIFVNWIMECISTISFSVLFNGGKSNFFTLTRGLRQGDPLSPYLFILCQEMLSRIIEREHATSSIQGVKMNVGGPSFTNVMYADDIMLFAKASRREVVTLNTCLEKYCDWSGQLINRDKSGVIFSKLVSRESFLVQKQTTLLK